MFVGMRNVCISLAFVYIHIYLYIYLKVDKLLVELAFHEEEHSKYQTKLQLWSIKMDIILY